LIALLARITGEDLGQSLFREHRRHPGPPGTRLIGQILRVPSRQVSLCPTVHAGAVHTSKRGRFGHAVALRDPEYRLCTLKQVRFGSGKHGLRETPTIMPGKMDCRVFLLALHAPIVFCYVFVARLLRTYLVLLR